MALLISEVESEILTNCILLTICIVGFKPSKKITISLKLKFFLIIYCVKNFSKISKNYMNLILIFKTFNIYEFTCNTRYK